MRKYLLSIAIFLVLLVSSAIFIPYLFKDEIVERIKTEVNAQLNAELSFNNDITINILKSFPNLSIAISDITIHHTDSLFTQDTLANIKKISTVLDLRELYQNQNVVLKAIAIDEPIIHLEYVNDSLYNWDIFNADDTSSSSLDLDLNSIAIKDGFFTYYDKPADFTFGLNNLNHQSKGKYVNGDLILDSKTETEELFVKYGDVAYINQWKVTQQGVLELLLSDEHYKVVKNQLAINGLPIELNGDVSYKQDDLVFNLEAISSSSEITDFLTLIPAVYQSDFEDIEASGKGIFEASYKGIYGDSSSPAFSVNLALTNGTFKYPDLPKSLESINLNLVVSSADGTYNGTVIDLNPCQFKLDNNPFSLQLKASNLEKDPRLAANAKGIINLSSIKQVLPLETEALEGTIQADFNIKGSSSSLEQKDFQRLYMDGLLTIDQMRLKTSAMYEELAVKKADLSFTNTTANIKELDANWGRNNVSASGYFENLIGYLTQGSALYGKLSASSTYLNLNHFLPQEQVEDSSVLETIRIPDNIELKANLSATRLIYDDYTFNNFKGIAAIKNQQLELSNINTDLWGGTAFLEGSYNAALEEPEADFTLSYSNISIANLFSNTSVLQKLVPVTKNVQGNTYAKLTLASAFKEGMKPDLNSLDLQGLLNVVELSLEESKLLNAISSKLEMPKFDARKLNDVVFNFKLNDGKLLVEPFTIYLDSSLIQLEGYSQLSGDINYKGLLSIPGYAINKKTTIVSNLTKNTPFADKTIRDDDYVNLNLQITGTLLKPEVKLSLNDLKKNLKQQVSKIVEDEVDKKKKEAEEAVNTELKKLKDEAQKKKEEAEEKLRQEIEKGKKEAEERLKNELDQTKTETEEKVKRKLENLIKKKK